MFLRLLYLYRNLTRNPRRTLLTCAAVTLPIVIFVLSMAVITAFETFLENSTKQLRLVVMHKTTLAESLPQGYRAKIEALDPTGQELESVCGMIWIGGQVEDNPTPLSTLAGDPDTLVETFPEHQLTPDEIAAWQRDRQAILVGNATAKQMGWKVGDHITIRPSMPPYSPLEFHVVSTLERAMDKITNWFHLPYLQEELKRIGAPADSVNFIFIKCASRAALERYRVAIDQAFARTPDETRTQDEKAFMSEFINQQFNLPRNLAILCSITVAVAVLAAMNTMSMSFRDRTQEFATLKSLGFGGDFAFLIIQAESILLCGLGGLVGALGPYIAFTRTPLREMTIPVVQTLIIEPRVVVQAVLIALFIGVAAALWPAYLAARLKVVDAMRSLE